MYKQLELFEETESFIISHSLRNDGVIEIIINKKYLNYIIERNLTIYVGSKACSVFINDIKELDNSLIKVDLIILGVIHV